MVVEHDGLNEANPEENQKQFEEQMQKMHELEKLRLEKGGAYPVQKEDAVMVDDEENSVQYMPAPITYTQPLPICANGVPQFRNSWHMSLFKLVASHSHKEVTK